MIGQSLFSDVVAHNANVALARPLLSYSVSSLSLSLSLSLWPWPLAEKISKIVTKATLTHCRRYRPHTD